MRQPLAYLQHRSAFMWNFLAADNHDDVDWRTSSIPTADRLGRTAPAFRMRLVSAARQAQADAAASRAGSWLLVCIVVCGVRLAATARRAKAAFALGVCGSAAVYVLSFSAVGVASDLQVRHIGRCWPASRAGSSASLRRRREGCACQFRSWTSLLRFGRCGPGLVVGVGDGGQFLEERRRSAQISSSVAPACAKLGMPVMLMPFLTHPEQLGRESAGRRLPSGPVDRGAVLPRA